MSTKQTLEPARSLEQPYDVDEPITGHAVVPHEEWLTARKELLKKEREITHQLDQLAIARRALPWERVEKDYLFDGPEGKVSLSDLFDGKRQLIIYHFMLAPGWEEGCAGCSFFADHVDGARQHFENADVSFSFVSRAPGEEIAAFKKRMGWKSRWVSCGANTFNQDYKTSFSKEQVEAGNIGYNYGTSPYQYEELPGLSVFYKDEDGNIFHTYSTYARGLGFLIGAHNFLDLTPKGRCEVGNTGPDSGWVRHHDKYGDANPKSCCDG